MDDAAANSPAEPSSTGRTESWLTRWTMRFLKSLAVLLVVYFLAAYVLLPMAWKHYEHHPSLAGFPKTTTLADGIPGDPLNIGLVGIDKEVVTALVDAGWEPADPISFRTSVRISESVLLGRSYPTAPVSSLYLFGRKQDLAFERQAGKSAKQRHHVRFWRTDDLSPDGRPLWIGSATFDHSVGLSHRTGEVTHHIAADVDADRDLLIHDLSQAGQLIKVYQVTGVGATLQGRNGGGDWYYTDGELSVGVIAAGNQKQSSPPQMLENPLADELKDQAWDWLRPLLQQ